MKKLKTNWFDILTTAWALALVLVALTWAATPAFARPGGGGGDCVGPCNDVCDAHGGCDGFSLPVGGKCYVWCDDGFEPEGGVNCGEV